MLLWHTQGCAWEGLPLMSILQYRFQRFKAHGCHFVIMIQRLTEICSFLRQPHSLTFTVKIMLHSDSDWWAPFLMKQLLIGCTASKAGLHLLTISMAKCQNCANSKWVISRVETRAANQCGSNFKHHPCLRPYCHYEDNWLEMCKLQLSQSPVLDKADSGLNFKLLHYSRQIDWALEEAA